MAKKVILSPQFTLQARDFLIGLFYAVGSSVLFVVQQSIDLGVLSLDYKKMGFAAVSGAVLYLGKKFVAKPTVKTVYESNDKAEAVAEQLKK